MRVRYWTGLGALVLSLGVAACSDGDTNQTFPPLDYSYLSQIHLNVASINVQDEAPATPDSLSAKAPTAPDEALKAMASQRLIASGSSGKADFIIKQAYLNRAGDNAVTGAMDVQLNIADAGNQHTGFVHARITRKLDAGDHDPTSRKELYTLTSQMMQDMNVELEFQIHKKLMSWMTDAAGTPLVNGGVQQQALGAPGTAPVSTPATPVVTTTAIPATPVTPEKTVTPVAAPSGPDAIFPTGADTETTTAPAIQHSPQPGTLQLPSTDSTATH
ncbi:hypothetical protein [Gluconobacter roseus]|uniref:Lipoprotein n=1 Tax=Gluconobacter roseus NBRC 3990 TaxID=1307950 RepID=A0A4Y3M8N8_9PROT|nr:hypothetical protein [Gluconobacter roseus]KXV44664.1 hypothetical protein AD943_02185 [Gluconobacter roseus]GBR43548.1 hypothetical protein AA3990_0462 [Gluconobacter roseus NBRC 3990]GEB04923.1 hypothetical protein GRO01_24990 [Gluconobacter roseus NBRC 3990]GLP94531.1 hypothetical protein GCM10007871_25090 [Gluconobacter roseus NBRC 3990]